MTETPRFVPNKNADDYRLISSDTPRAMMEPHWIRDDGVLRMVLAATQVVVGTMRAEGSEDYQPSLRIDHAYSRTSLLILMTPEELRVIANSMNDIAGNRWKSRIGRQVIGWISIRRRTPCGCWRKRPSAGSAKRSSTGRDGTCGAATHARRMATSSLSSTTFDCCRPVRSAVPACCSRSPI